MKHNFFKWLRTGSTIFTLFTFLSLGVGQMWGASITSDGTMRLFFNMNAVDWWIANSGNGNFAYFYGSGNAWSAHSVQQTGNYYYVVVPSGTWDHVIMTRNNTSTSPSWDNKWNQTGDIELQSGKNYISSFGENSNSATFSTYQVVSTASLAASSASITTAQTATLTPSLSSNAEYNEIKSTSYTVTTNPGSAGSVTSAGVFSATAAGTYTVTATVTYNAKGFSGITKTATATKSITVSATAETTHSVSLTYVCTLPSPTTISAATSQTIGEESAATVTAPTIDGYTFTNWTLGTGVSNLSENTSANPISVKTLSSGEYTMQANYDEDLSTPYVLNGGTVFGNSAWSQARELSKKPGHSTESVGYLGVVIIDPISNENAANYNFKITQGETWYGLPADGDAYWFLRSTTEQTLSSSGKNIQLRADVYGYYEIKVDYTNPASPKISVTFQSAHTITWKDGDGNTLKTELVADGMAPIYDGATPTKTATAQYTYTFNETWSPEIILVEEDATYTAQFDATVNKYTVTWKNADDTTLETDENVEYGATPSYDGEMPEKTATAQYTYTFTGWSPAITSVTGNATYTAQFDATINTYDIVWEDGDGNTLKTDKDVPYGTTPEYTGATPTKTATAQYIYTFNGTWSPAITPVTGNATYTAQFDEAPRSYSVTLNLNGGENQGANVTSYTYGTGATLPIYVLKWGYRFDGWYTNEGLTGDPVTAIADDATGDKEYWAKWTQIATSYTVSEHPEFAALEAGDIIVVSVEAQPSSGAEIYLYEINGDWSSTHHKSISATGQYLFELTEAQAEDLRHGIHVTGTNYKMGYLKVLYRKSVWNEGVDGREALAEANFDKALFDGFEEDFILGVEVAALKEGVTEWEYQIQAGDDPFITNSTLKSAGTYLHELTSDQKVVYYTSDESFKIRTASVSVSELYIYIPTRSYNVTLHSNEGTINAGNIESYTYGIGATLPTNVTKTGYDFGGWYDNEGLTGDPVTAIADDATGDKEYWAKWTVATYTVTLNTNGGTNYGTNVESYTYGVGATLPIYVTKWANKFDGWYDNENLEGDPVAEITTTDFGNKTYWAKWTSIQNEMSASAHPEFKLLEEGDIVVVSITEAQANSGAKIVLYGRTSWGVTHQKSISAPGEYVFELTAAQAEDFHAGIILTGYNFTSDGVQVFYRKNAWDKGIDGRTALAEADLEKALFNGLIAGDFLGVEVAALKEGATEWEYQIQAGDDPLITNSTLNATGICYHELSAEQVTVLQDPAKSIKIGSASVLASKLYTYTANKYYTITWLDDDDSLIDKTEVAYGEMPVHGVPTKAADDQYTYSFDTWNPAVVAVTADATYKAVYTSTLRKYTVTIVNDSVGYGTVSATEIANVPYGTLFVIENETPNVLSIGEIVNITATPAESTSKYKYEFKGWVDVPTSVAGDVTIHVGFIRTDLSPATALDDVNEGGVKVEKFMRDNKIYIRVNGRVYDASGRLVE